MSLNRNPNCDSISGQIGPKQNSKLRFQWLFIDIPRQIPKLRTLRTLEIWSSCIYVSTKENQLLQIFFDLFFTRENLSFIVACIYVQYVFNTAKEIHKRG